MVFKDVFFATAPFWVNVIVLLANKEVKKGKNNLQLAQYSLDPLDFYRFWTPYKIPNRVNYMGVKMRGVIYCLLPLSVICFGKALDQTRPDQTIIV